MILDTDSILRYANNFFATSAPVAYILIGTMIGGFVVATLITVVRRAR